MRFTKDGQTVELREHEGRWEAWNVTRCELATLETFDSEAAAVEALALEDWRRSE